MIGNPKRRIRVYRIVLMLAVMSWSVVICVMPAATAAAAADDAIHFRLSEMERRMNAWDSDKIVERIARLETAVENTNRIAISSLGIMVGMLADRLLRRQASEKRRETDE